MTSRIPARAAAVMLIAAAVGLTIALQGWRSRGPDSDVTAALVRAVGVVARGAIPPHGTLTDLGSYFPAGTTYLLVPGVVLFSDPRIIELSATGGLYLLTLLGMFLLAHRLFDVRVAVAAVVLYAVSQQALTLAGWLWPRGHPVFYVWIAWCCERWVSQRSRSAPALAIGLWLFGMYVYFELAPAILMVLATRIAFRPPISKAGLVSVAAIGAVLWMPYLRFEATRGFADVQSQLLMRSLGDRGPERSPLCGEEQPSMALQSPNVDAAPHDWPR